MNAEERKREIRKGRVNATQAEFLAAAKWVMWCRRNGWADKNLLPLEALWWKYHKPALVKVGK